MLNKIYEPETTEFFTKVLKPNDKVIIAGGHHGYFALLASDLVVGGCVYVFEPEKSNFKILEKNTKGRKNIKLFNFALGDKKCDAKLFINDDDDGGHALWDISLNVANVKSMENQRVQTIEVEKLDDVMENENIESLKLILLDVEGSEHSILKGGINTIIDLDVPYIICEINNFALKNCGTSQAGLRSFMKTYGYKEHSMNGEDFSGIPINQELFAYNNKEEVVFNMLFSRNGTG